MNSLSYKIGLGYFLIIILNISLAIFAIYHINSMREPLDNILKENFRNISAAENMKLSFTQQELTQLSMVESSIDSIHLAHFKNYEERFRGWFEQAYHSIALPAEVNILDSLKDEYATFLHNSDSLHSLISIKETYLTYKAYHYNNIIPVASRITALCNRLKEVNEQAIFQAENKAKGISFRAKILISIFAVVTVFISILAGIYLTRKIIQPLKKTTDSVRKIRKGQFNQKVAITTNDEIAELGIEFNSMTDRINHYMRDVSGLKELDRLKSDFMSTISHEFKTPLTSINMIIDILLKEIQGELNEEQKELLKIAKNDITRLKEFSRELLELSKLESGTTVFNIEAIDTRRLLDYTLQPFQSILKEKNLKTITTINQNAQTVEADFKQLARVITNLLDNAIRFTDDNGEIGIHVSANKDYTRFSVKDNGKGISPESLDLIFDKFFQAGNNQNSNIGLGLAICREIIEQHNGKIWVESTPHKGSTFYFTIPITRKK